MIEEPGALGDAVERVHTDLIERRAVARLLEGDHSLWADSPTEITNRLGWLDEPGRMRDRVADLRAFAGAVRDEGARRAVWCGMGGSSLFPLVLREAFGSTADSVDLKVLDTSHPAAVARAAAAAPRGETLWCFASKSGGTIETRSHLDYLWDFDPTPSRFVAVTDAGSRLDTLASDRGFRATFHANPDIGGRFSALSHFGHVPASLLGVDVAGLLDSAGEAHSETISAAEDHAGAPATRLAAFLGACALAGRDKCTLAVPPAMPAFGLWLEQLVAESTGKSGVGILPVVGEPLGGPEVYSDDRVFVAYGDDPSLTLLSAAGHPVVRLGPLTPHTLGAEVYRWEVTVALTCAILGVNPFDQPDVEAAKRAAGVSLAGGGTDIPTEAARSALDAVGAGGYVSIQAFVDPEDALVASLARARLALRDRLRVPVTLDLGPRYLHSTGQLHKGGPAGGVFLQVVDPGDDDLKVPGRDFSFGRLLRAQADGDYTALATLGRPIARTTTEDLLATTGF